MKDHDMPIVAVIDSEGTCKPDPTWQCERCGQTFNVRGKNRHLRFCAGTVGARTLFIKLVADNYGSEVATVVRGLSENYPIREVWPRLYGLYEPHMAADIKHLFNHAADQKRLAKLAPSQQKNLQPCAFCGKLYQQEKSLAKHQSTCSRNPNSDNSMRPCQWCGSLLHPNGLKMHERSCDDNPDRVIAQTKKKAVTSAGVELVTADVSTSRFAEACALMKANDRLRAAATQKVNRCPRCGADPCQTPVVCGRAIRAAAQHANRQAVYAANKRRPPLDAADLAQLRSMWHRGGYSLARLANFFNISEEQVKSLVIDDLD